MDVLENKKKLLFHIGSLLAVGLLFFVDYRWPFYTELSGAWWYFLAWLVSLILLAILFLNILVRIPKRIDILFSELGSILNLGRIGKGFVHIRNVNFGKVGIVGHIIVGPSGIWVVELKGYGGDISFSGDALTRDGSELKGLIGHMLAQAAIIQNFLRQKIGKQFAVHPVVVVFNANSIIKIDVQPPRGVYVVRSEELSKTVLAGGNVVIDNDTVKIIHGVLKRANLK